MTWTWIIELVLLVLKWLLLKTENEAEAMRLFYKFVHSINANYLNSASADESLKKQAEELNKILNEVKPV